MTSTVFAKLKAIKADLVRGKNINSGLKISPENKLNNSFCYANGGQSGCNAGDNNLTLLSCY